MRRASAAPALPLSAARDALMPPRAALPPRAMPRATPARCSAALTLMPLLFTPPFRVTHFLFSSD